LRPIYLISKTPYEGVIHIPILKTFFFTPEIDFSRYEGLIVTSKQIFQALEPYPSVWKSLPIIAVSSPTADVFRAHGCTIAATANGYGKEIIPILKNDFKGFRWLYLRPKTVASEWAQSARDNGIWIEEAVMYETACNDAYPMSRIDPNGILIFTSPSSVRCFLKRYTIADTQRIVAIGTTTRSALDDAKEVLISPETSVASAVDLARKIAR
jgi:uroporphyrinogen-III synthase